MAFWSKRVKDPSFKINYETESGAISEFIGANGEKCTLEIVVEGDQVFYTLKKTPTDMTTSE